MRYEARERITALCIIGGCLFLRFWVIPNFIEITEEYELASLSPSFFPVIATWVIAGLACLHLVLGFARKTASRTAEETDEWLTPAEEHKAYLCALIIIAYFFATKYVGFLISTVLMLMALFIIEGVRPFLKVALTAVLVTIGVFLFFLYVMQVHFPVGAFFE